MAEELAIRAWRRGRVRILAISGELDMVTAGGFVDRALAAVAARHDSVLPDLGEPLAIDYPGVREGAEMTRQPDGQRPRSLVVDLSRLQFIDCAGTRALADLISVASLAWPVLTYRASAPVRRTFDLLGFHTGSTPGGADGLYVRPVRELTGEGEAIRLQARILRAHTCELRGLIAEAREQLASTRAGLAGHRPPLRTA